MRAPALARCAHRELMRSALDKLVRDILHGNAAAIMYTPLTQDELHQLQADMSTIRASMEIEIDSKMDYWLRLPCVLCGCSHPNETLARQVAISALEPFKADDRAVVHDAKTFALMQPGCEFRRGLEQFAGGASRWVQNEEFVLVIASMRFFPVAERSIEEKRAQVSLEGNKTSHRPLQGVVVQPAVPDEYLVDKTTATAQGLGFEVSFSPRTGQLGFAPWPGRPPAHLDLARVA